MLSKITILVLLSFSVCFCADSPQVKTSSGVVKGKTIQVLDKSINQFLNIPYAELPVGKLRFSKPLPLKEPIKGIIDGTKTGNSCFQNDPRSKIIKTNEDCLVLNVLSPESKDNSSALKPVMFWIYGGGYYTGSIFSFDNNTDNNILPIYDVVVVSVNYRLGPFGWLYGGEESAPGNLGLYDQLLALNWVKENIASFGGDPNQITIFGESAGSWSVSAQVLSPKSKGLFKRAILQSGAILGNKNTPSLTKTAALNQAKQMAQHFNCSDDKQWLDCLRSIDAKQLNNYHGVRPYVIEGTDFLPVSAQKALKTLDKDIDIMAGVMQNEGSILTHLSYPKAEQLKSREEFLDIIKSTGYLFPELNLDKISEFYLKNVDTNSTEALKMAFYDYFGDIFMKCPTYFFAKQFAEHLPKKNILFYEWTYPAHLLAPLLGCTKEMGVCHASDLEYIFGYPVLRNTTDKEFSEDVMKMWTNFAKNGNPLEGFPANYHWPRIMDYASAANNITRVKEINPSKPNHIFENPFHKECDQFWSDYFN